MARGSKSPNKKSDAITIDAIKAEGKVLPHSLEVEEMVLAQLLIDPDCHQLFKEEINKPDIFYLPRHQMIYKAVEALMNESNPVDAVFLSEKLRAQGNLDIVGADYIIDLSNRASSAFHYEGYLKLLKEKYIQRELILAAGKIQADAFDEGVDVETLISSSQNWVYAAAENNIKKDAEIIGSVMSRVLNELDRRQASIGTGSILGVPSGIRGLDSVTLGFQKSDLIILAARPSVGKTALALNMARNAAVDHHIPVAVFSLEMPASQLVNRLMLAETDLSAAKIKGGEKLETWEWQELHERTRALSEAPIYIDDTPALPIMEFASKCKRLVHEKGVQLIVVDYLQLLQGPKSANGLREQEVAAVSRTLKATAKDLQVPIIALSQLSRMTMNRAGGNNRPMLSDLRESGSIEQDADMVLFIHRYDYQNSGDETVVGKTELIIAKHRNGSLADVPLKFIADKALFQDDDSSADFVKSIGSSIQGSASNPGSMSGEFSSVNTGF